MPTEIIMPQMGESIAEGTITKWLKKVGDPIKRDEPIFEISTDKVDAEIPAPVAGTLTEIRVGEGQTVAINTVVGLIGEASEATATAPAATASAPAAAPARPPEPARETAAAPPPPPAPAKPATPPVAASPPAAAAPPRAQETAPRPSAPAPAAPPPPPPAPATAPPPARVETAPEPGAGRVESIEERIRLRSSPLVRKIAAEHGVDIREIEGTGIYNRVTKNDVLSYVENRQVAGAGGGAVPTAPREAPRAPEPTGPARIPAGEPAAPERPSVAATDRDEIVAMTKIRKITAENMILSKQTSAHVTTVFHVDYTNVARLRERNKEAFLQKNGVKLTYLPFIFRAAIQALKEFPQVNASIDGDNIVYHKDIHLGMAVALDWGLIVPVIKNADEKSILGLARAAQDLAERARSKRLKPDEIHGGTFTVTNPGVFGSLFGTPIIPQPQVAILGVGTIEKRPVVVEDENGNDALGIRTVGYLALSFDHRLIDGADADRFMAAVKKTLEKGEFDLG
jgi:pyruvate dehydrogenase E2 component (dihydrolipoamide acetyltransferase)